MNIIIDYFQPINKSHIQVAQKLYERNGKNSIFIAVFHEDLPKRYPIPEKIVRELLEKAQESNDVIIDHFVVYDWNMESIISKIKGKYFPSVIACTTKRIKDYSLQLEFYLKHNKTSPFKKSILIEVEHNEFGGELRDALYNNDIGTFKIKTPDFLHPYFETLVQYYQVKDESEENENVHKLVDHFDFFKMVINRDSTVNLKSSLIEVLDTTRKRLDLEKENEYIKDLCFNSGFTENEAIEFFDRVIIKAGESEIIKLIDKLKTGIDLDYNVAKIIELGDEDVYDIMKHAIEFRPIKRDNFGSGEFLTSILFAGAFKADVGDVIVFDERIEVKNNECQLASIRTSNLSPSFSDINIHAKKQVQKLLSKLNEIKKVSNNLTYRINQTTTSRKFNISQKGISLYMELMRFIIKHFRNSEKLCIDWFVNLFYGGVLADEDKIEISRPEFVEKIKLTLSGKLSSKGLLSFMTYVTFKYYARVDDFKGMLIYRSNIKNTKSLYCGYIPNDVSYEDYDRIIEPVSGPSISDPRTSRVFKIRLKSIDK